MFLCLVGVVFGIVFDTMFDVCWVIFASLFGGGDRFWRGTSILWNLLFRLRESYSFEVWRVAAGINIHFSFDCFLDVGFGIV